MTDLLLDALATYRLTRLVISDTIIDEPRARLLIHLETTGHPKLAYLAGCPWCLSIYVGAAVVIARRRAPRAWDPIARALSYSAVAGIVHTLTTRD